MKVAVVMNRAAGSVDADHGAQPQQLRDVLAAAGIEAHVHVCKGAQLTDTARELAATGVDAVVAAGGDGTVSAVATALAGGKVPMAVLPLGTLNHFARDLGVPDDLALAAQAIAGGRFGFVDIGEVNGRVFINNSSIGLYPEMVRSRDAERKRTGRRKWTAMLLAAIRVLRRFPLLRVRVATAESATAAVTPFLFVGNNEYTINVLELGQREHLDRGRLSLYMVRCRSRFQMFWLMLRGMVQKLETVAEFETAAVTEAWVGVGRRRRQLEVAVDGEVVMMQSPLHYKMRAGALPVLFPPAASAVDSATPATEPAGIAVGASS
jgi:diacylglycerol kinase family enzyme